MKQYGIDSDWDVDTQDMFLLNCDAELLTYLKREDIEFDESVYKTGLALGVFVIQKEITRKYYESYGENLDYNIKDDMFEEIQETVYDYVINGAIDAY